MNSETAPWTVAESEHDGVPVLFRFRQDEGIQLDRRIYPHHLNIIWQCADVGASQMPTSDENERMRIFEDRLVQATGYDEQSILAGVLTGKGKREFIFQARDPKVFTRSLTEMPQEVERYPIEIHYYEDPTWDYFDRVTKNL